MSKDESRTNNIYLLWLLYPILLLIYGYVSQSLSREWSNMPDSDKIITIMGSATGIFILTLIVSGIRKLFSKKKLSPGINLLFFYGVSTIAFIGSIFNEVNTLR